jgi:hypothetical protein
MQSSIFARAVRVRRLLLVVALLVGAPATTASAQRAARPAPAAARGPVDANARARDGQPTPPRNPAVKPLVRGTTGMLRRIVSSHPTYGAQIREARQQGALIESTGARGSLLAARRAWVPLVSVSRPLRRAVTRSLLRDLSGRSSLLAAALEKGTAQGVWDTLYVGAGVHSATSANALSQADPSHRMLVVESTDVVSANFRNLGETIRINSSSRANDGKGIQPFGKGDNNPFEGPVGVPDIDGGQKWPVADTLADAATISLASSGADVLLRTGVDKIERTTGGPAKYKVTLRTSSGKKVEVFAQNVAIASGLGDPNPGLRDPRAAARVKGYLARERQKLERGQAPGLMYYSDAMQLASESVDPLEPYRVPYRATKDGVRVADRANAPKIAIVGPGDSGKTFVELLLGLGPASAYEGPGKVAPTQLGGLGDVDWVTPGAFRDSTEFVSTVRPRYSQGTADLKAGRIKPLDAKVDDIRETRDGRYTLTYRFTARPFSEGERVPTGYEVVAVAGGRFVAPADSKRSGAAIDERGNLTWTSSKTYDRVVLATGFDSKVADFARPLLPEGFAENQTPFAARTDVLEPVAARPKGSVKSTTVAKRIKGEDVFLIGPAAGNDLVKRDATVGISENLASIKFLGPYSAAVGRSVLVKGKSAAAGIDRDAVYAAGRDGKPLKRTKGTGSSRHAIPADAATSREARWVEATGLDFEILLKQELAVVLDGFDLAGYKKGDRLELTLGLDRQGSFELRGTLDRRSLARLGDQMSRQPALMAMLDRGARAATGRRYQALRVTVPVNSRSLDYTSMGATFER